LFKATVVKYWGKEMKKRENELDRIQVKKEGTNEKEVEWTYCCPSASPQ
jgi:hypothetical protein